FPSSLLSRPPAATLFPYTTLFRSEQETREARIKGQETALAEREKEAQALLAERRQRLERIAGLTAVQARRELVRDIEAEARQEADRKSTRLNSSHDQISYAVFCLK